MPEGPEIRKAADKVEKVVTSTPVDDIFFAFQHLKRFERRLRHERVDRVDTRGKAMLIRFCNGLAIYSHNQLYGRWYTSRRDRPLQTRRQLRLALHCGEKSALLYSASDIEVLSAQQEDRHPYLSRLGPDILSCGPAAVLEQLRDSRYHRRRFTSLYLDQQFLAGVGNYLRSEILFEAKLHPTLRPVDCSAEQLQTLARASTRIPRRSYRHNGVTCNPELARELKNRGQARRQYRHWVFDRDRQPCRVCDTPVSKALAGRRFYYCPCCQQA